MTDIQSILSSSPLILSECAISERLRRDPEIELHPSLFLTPLIYEEKFKTKLKAIYKEYRDIAARACLPILLCAPTWRVDKERLATAGYDEKLLFDAVGFMQELRDEWHRPDSPVLLGALLAPKNDCYSPSEALGADEAFLYHSWQVNKLATAAVDCLIAQTIPATSEGLGLAKAISATKTPYIISFVINREAHVLDGTSLSDAITLIDRKIENQPLGYMVNCVYPTFLCAAQQDKNLFKRLIGIQANSSSLDHSQLEGSAILHQDDLSHWGEQMLLLNNRFGVKILGGCCGTDGTYLQYLVDHRPEQSSLSSQ
jgi:homocysteine S-methyltransferase